MPRPRHCRRVCFQPNTTYFKPAGIPRIRLQECLLSVDEFEAVRLKDLLGLEQEEAAAQMNISQPTFHRLLAIARKKIADALVNGKSIKIQGGSYQILQQEQSRSGKRHQFQGQKKNCTHEREIRKRKQKKNGSEQNENSYSN